MKIARSKARGRPWDRSRRTASGQSPFIVYGDDEECDIATAGDDLHFERDADESTGDFYERIKNGLPVSGHTQVVYLWKDGPAC